MSKTPQKRREYSPAGHRVLRKNLDGVLQRVRARDVPDDHLEPLELAAREFRRSLIGDQGGLENLSAARLAVTDVAVGSWLIQQTIDAYLFRVGESGVVNRRNRKVYRVVADRQKISDSLVRQLQALGLERREPPAEDLRSYLEKRSVES